MPGRSYRQYCSLARALDVVGDRWSMLVIRNLFLGPQRWSELRSTLPGVAKNLLSSRLKGLEASGVLVHEDGLYTLTERGRALQPALFLLADWGEQHFMGPPEEEDAFRLRYLMTSMRRKLRPTSETGVLQLWVGEEAFAVRLGAKPDVVQGEVQADATLRCDLSAFRALLFMGAPLQSLVDEGRAVVSGDPTRVDALLEAWPA